MRMLHLAPFLLATLLLSGCATPSRPVSRVAAHPSRPVARTTARPEALPAEASATASPIVKASSKPAAGAPEAGSGIPLSGFRPMKGQAATGL